ncbi:hypothetical protein SSPO_070140 [Streptomyces antimycoticus]|uniref:Uncharacterized protein n=1 Tax=Streptomyces antimycoticus TaxID=68175 RepID=A0A499V7Q3_9ACTN|nr:hypothetical protein SSPO_070140 [Streptomyces antimycoticus]
MLQIKRFRKGYPEGPSVRPGPGPGPQEPPPGPTTTGPSAGGEALAPPSPVPMLNGAEGARRDPHRATGPSTVTRPRRSHAPRQMVEIAPLEPPDKGSPRGWLRGDDGHRGVAFADEYEVRAWRRNLDTLRADLTTAEARLPPTGHAQGSPSQGVQQVLDELE